MNIDKVKGLLKKIEIKSIVSGKILNFDSETRGS